MTFDPSQILLEVAGLDEDKQTALDKTPEGNDPDEQFANWYLARMAGIKQQEEIIKEQTSRMLNNLRHQRAGLQWRYGAEFQGIVDRRLEAQGGKKKSVNFHMGRAGYRSSPGRLQIIDAEAAEKYAIEQKLWHAMRIELRLTPFKEIMELTGEVPDGFTWLEPRDTFYPAAPERLDDHTLAMLEGEDHV